ncbi:hypothetical protein A33K_16631 [Burkholderia humptydooensis MSMB43]|uniref:Uncharacterized protein n=1 Tax=Burkholderia humptydooensis MSMB43 TaxID=441157 RepID=A0ABN0G448_9BURK|nr:hypothetical protein A33K_16631 [Burkholderia humptydooensis MSMB43]
MAAIRRLAGFCRFRSGFDFRLPFSRAWRGDSPAAPAFARLARASEKRFPRFELRGAIEQPRCRRSPTFDATKLRADTSQHRASKSSSAGVVRPVTQTNRHGPDIVRQACRPTV